MKIHTTYNVIQDDIINFIGTCLFVLTCGSLLGSIAWVILQVINIIMYWDASISVY